MHKKQFEEALVNAIHSKQLRTVLSKMKRNSRDFSVGTQEKLRGAVEAIEAIEDSTRQEMRRICNLFAKNSIPLLQVGAAESEEIVHLFEVSVGRSWLEEAATLLEENGYFTPMRSSRFFWRRYAHFYDRVDFSGDKQLPFRVALSWRPSGNRGRLARILKPGIDDLKYIAIPKPLWPAYCGVKFVRRILGKTIGKDIKHLGPFLGTPEDMIGPLLSFADLRSDHQLVDIGCGDGRILLKAATEFGCRVVGYETDDSLLQLAESEVKRQDCQNLVTLLQVDANDADVSDADVVFVFLPANVTDGIVTTLLPKMKAGAVLVAHEQHELKTTAKPIRRMPLILPCGVSVAYKWQA